MLKKLLNDNLSPRASLIKWLLGLEGHPIYESICWNVLRQLKIVDFENRNIFLVFLDQLNTAIDDPNNSHLLPKPDSLIEFVIYKDEASYDPRGPFCLIGNFITPGDNYCEFASKSNCYVPDHSSKSIGEELCKFEPFSSFQLNAVYDSSLSYEDPEYYTEKVLKGDIPKPQTPLRGRKPFCWVTTKSAIDDIINEKNTKRLISELGLLHFVEKDEKYVLTIYPKDFKLNKICKPTFIEGIRTPFRVNDSDEFWGGTVNLQSGEFAQPEAVHCPHTRNNDFIYDEWEKCENFIDEIDLNLILKKGHI